MVAAPPLEISYTPGFVPNAIEMFERARDELAWDARMAARQTASCGFAYNYSGNFYSDVAMPDFVAALAERIACVVSHPMTNCLANLYATGESRMGFHSDSEAGIVPDTSIAVVSLGSLRSLTFRAKASPAHSRSFALESGSLLVMAASVQDLWKHALLAAPGASPRISLTFRSIARPAECPRR